LLQSEHALYRLLCCLALTLTLACGGSVTGPAMLFWPDNLGVQHVVA